MFPCLWCQSQVQPGQTACTSCQKSLIVNGYHLNAFLGRGGVGSVYQATSPAGRQVAVKVVALSQGADWKTFELFEKSSQMLQSLSHQGLPKVYGFAKSDDGKLFLFREVFEGGTLHDRIKQGASLEPHNVRALTEKILQILHYLHARVPPIYHRDIKPSNIMFRSPMSWDPVLVDFDTVTFATQLTGNTLIGTPGYTAPEQFAGMISPASDLYSVGATLLYVATHVEPDALPKRDGKFQVNHLLQNVDEGARSLILKALDPERQNRPQSAQEALSLLGSAPSKNNPALGFQVSFKGDPPATKTNVGPHQLQGLKVAAPPEVAVKMSQVKSGGSSTWLIFTAFFLLLGVGAALALLTAGTEMKAELVSMPPPIPQQAVEAPAPEPPSPEPVKTAPQQETMELFETPKEGASTPKKETGPPPKPPLPPEKRLTTQEIRAVLLSDDAKKQYAACVKFGEGTVKTKLTIETSGNISVVSTDNSEPLGVCVARVIRRLKFPTFTGDSQSVSIPIVVRASANE